MKTTSSVQAHETFIQASAEKLWESLTSGELTPNYFFGTIVKSSFKKGEPIRFDLPDGSPTVEGTVVECEPGRRLVHTWKICYDPSLADETSTVEWRLEPRGKACKVVALHDFAGAPKTAEHLGPGRDGWSVVLSGLKTFLETGKPLDMPMAG